VKNKSRSHLVRLNKAIIFAGRAQLLFDLQADINFSRVLAGNNHPSVRGTFSAMASCRAIRQIEGRCSLAAIFLFSSPRKGTIFNCFPTLHKSYCEYVIVLSLCTDLLLRAGYFSIQKCFGPTRLFFFSQIL